MYSWWFLGFEVDFHLAICSKTFNNFKTFYISKPRCINSHINTHKSCSSWHRNAPPSRLINLYITHIIESLCVRPGAFMRHYQKWLTCKIIHDKLRHISKGYVMHRISLVMILIVVFTFSACQTATNHMLKSKNENSHFFWKSQKCR